LASQDRCSSFFDSPVFIIDYWKQSRVLEKIALVIVDWKDFMSKEIGER
jgi:hypothetical protein